MALIDGTTVGTLPIAEGLGERFDGALQDNPASIGHAHRRVRDADERIDYSSIIITSFQCSQSFHFLEINHSIEWFHYVLTRRWHKEPRKNTKQFLITFMLLTDTSNYNTASSKEYIQSNSHGANLPDKTFQWPQAFPRFLRFHSTK